MKKAPATNVAGAFCDPAGIRTQDPLIKSQVLCQLSYGIAFQKRLQRYNPQTFIKVERVFFPKSQPLPS